MTEIIVALLMDLDTCGQGLSIMKGSPDPAICLRKSVGLSHKSLYGLFYGPSMFELISKVGWKVMIDVILGAWLARWHANKFYC